ncbi:MAG: hypothetical protein SGI74_00300 [Oligoflexia bacterium]|nr:hypothetical protein [Oligoflexia bacterium]
MKFLQFLTPFIVLSMGCGPKYLSDPVPPKDSSQDFWSVVNGKYQNVSGTRIEFDRNAKTFSYYAPSTSFEPYLLNPKKMKTLANKNDPTCAHVVTGSVLKYSQRPSWFGSGTKETYLEFEIDTKVSKTIYYSNELKKTDELAHTSLGLAKFACESISYSILPIGFHSLTLASYNSDVIVFNDAKIYYRAPKDQTRQVIQENLIFHRVE